MKKQHVQLSETDRATLIRLMEQGTLGVKQCKRALGLLELDRGKTCQAVAMTLDVNHNTVAGWRAKYQQHGLAFLHDQPRIGWPVVIDGVQRAKLTALACSEAPVGHAQWNLRLLAEKAVELGYCPQLSHTKVRKILKKMC